MIQIEYQKNGSNARKKVELVEFQGLDTHLGLFTKLDEYIGQIEPSERVNLHYTVGYVAEPHMVNEKWVHKKLRYQQIIPIDIDWKINEEVQTLPKDKWQTYRDLIAGICEINPECMSVIWSGHGLHFLIHTKNHMTEAFITQTRDNYKVLCDCLNERLSVYQLPGKCDTGVYRKGATLRLPGTINRKPNMPDAKSELLQVGWEIAWSLDRYKPDKETSSRKEVLTKTHDKKAVLSGCTFLKYAKENPDKIDRKTWWFQNTVLAVFGEGIVHEYSKGYKTYSHQETQRMYEDIVGGNYGPAYCKTIDKCWGRCHECPYYKKVNKPTDITSSDFISTASTGFRKRIYDDQANLKKSPVDIEGLTLQFKKEYGPTTIIEGLGFYYYDGKSWLPISKGFIAHWAQQKVSNPILSSGEAKEIVHYVYHQDYVKLAQALHNNKGKLNFKNGVFDFKTNQFREHRANDYFFYQLDCEYDPTAKCTQWDKFCTEVIGDEKVVRFLEEYIGQGLAGVPNRVHETAVIFNGSGRNGKSTFLNVIRYILGDKTIIDNDEAPLVEGDKTAFSAVTFANLEKNALSMVGKLFNLSDESPANAANDAQLRDKFKAIVSGNTTEVKKLYLDSTQQSLNVKMIFSINRLFFKGSDDRAFLERFKIVPFTRYFQKRARNKNLAAELIKEAPGIVNKFIQGHNRLKLQDNEFTHSPILDEMTKEYQSGDPIYQFIDEILEVTGNKENYVRSDELFARFEQFNKGGFEIKRQPFLTGLQSILQPMLPQDFKVVQQPREEKRHRCFYGIRFYEGEDL
jgi:P4 family phage/plasmid primase-like protien